MEQTPENYAILAQELTLPAYQGKDDVTAASMLNEPSIASQPIDFTVAALQHELTRWGAYGYYKMAADASSTLRPSQLPTANATDDTAQRGAIAIVTLATSANPVIATHEAAIRQSWITAVTAADVVLPLAVKPATAALKDLATGNWSRAWQLFGYNQTVASGDVSRARAGTTT